MKKINGKLLSGTARASFILCLFFMTRLLCASEEGCMRVDILCGDKSAKLKPSEVKKGRAANMAWKKDGGLYGASITVPGALNEWKEETFLVSSDKASKAKIILKGPYIKREDGELKKQEVDYSLLKFNGKVLFETPEDKPLRLWHNKAKLFDVELPKDSSCRITVRYKIVPPAGLPPSEKDFFLDISKHANMGFEDEVAGDGKGGWSDQGENDLRDFDYKQKLFGTVPFEIINPAKNNGKAVMTFASKNLHPNLNLKSALIECDANAKKGWEYLYVLHTSCWTNKELVGRIIVTKANGKTISFDIKNMRDVKDWWKPLPLENAMVAYEYNNNPTTGGGVGFYMSRFRIGYFPEAVKSVEFRSIESDPIWIVLGATLSNKLVNIKKNLAVCRIQDGKDGWKKVDMDDLDIREGSALDLSRFVKKGTVDEKGRIVICNGHFEYENKPGERVKFNSCAISMFGDIARVALSKEELRDLARQIRMYGYNMIRVHNPERSLMHGMNEELKLNREILDRFDYFIYCLKQEGVYLFYDCGTAHIGWRPFDKWKDYKKRCASNFKGKMLGDVSMRENWEKGVYLVLNHKNPYTGTTLAEDPIFVATVFYNEQNLRFGNAQNLSSLNAPWHEWLKKKYGTLESLEKAWTGKGGISAMPCNVKSFKDIPLNVFAENTPWGLDSNRFFYEALHDLDKWYVKVLHSTGAKVAYNNWDCGRSLIYALLRNDMNSICIHGYHTHPSNYVKPKSTQQQLSSVKADFPAMYFTNMAMTRYLDRPLLITEYLHCFWNKYRYEEGLLIGAYSAFQDYDCLTPHASPVTKFVRKHITCFRIYNDPVQRASEVVARYLFKRGDMKPAKKRMLISVDMEKAFTEGANFQKGMLIPKDLQPLFLIAGAGMGLKNAPLPEGIEKAKADTIWNLPLTMPAKPGKLWPGLLAQMRESGVIDKDNASDPEKGYYESAGKAIKLDSEKGTLKVKTPMLEGIAFTDPAEYTVDKFTVKKASLPGAATVIAIDDKELEKSLRLLFVTPTNALNHDMEFYGKDFSFLKRLPWTYPVIKTGKLELELKTELSGEVEAWALAFNGERKERIPAEIKEGKLCVKIDMASLKTGPTFFYEAIIKAQ